MIALPVGAHLLWRHHYYGFWLPNTFYAKVGGAWWTQAQRYFALFLTEYRVHWFAPLALIALARGRCFQDLLFGAVLAVYLTYLGYIGGDRFEFRFLVVVLPYFYLLVAAGLERLLRFEATTSALRRGARAVAAATALALLASTVIGSAREPNKDWSEARVLQLAAIATYAEHRVREGTALRQLIGAGVLPEDLRISTGGAGALPYYTRWHVLDYRGLNDIHIAHAPIERRGDIGQEKAASLDYMREARVVVFDVLNRLLFNIPPRLLEYQTDRARGSVRWHNRKAERDGDVARLRFECRVVGHESFLIFASPLGPTLVDAVLGHLPRCPPTGAQQR